ncbi:MAG: 4Fe-4S binding protein [Candidatus Helarchaeales archaeon]
MKKSIPPEIDYDYCKGCLVCAESCPARAIEAVEEAKFHEMDEESDKHA